jgi:hypothetical protein
VAEYEHNLRSRSESDPGEPEVAWEATLDRGFTTMLARAALDGEEGSAMQSTSIEIHGSVDATLRHLQRQQEAEPYDALLISHGEDEDKCIDLITRMRQLEDTCWVPVIVYDLAEASDSHESSLDDTAEETRYRRKRFQRLGAYDYCHTFETLLHALERLMCDEGQIYLGQSTAWSPRRSSKER